MRKNFFFYLTVLSIMSLSKSFAQDTLHNSNPKQDSLKIQANRFIQAFVKLDTLEFIKYAHPIVIDKYNHGAQNVGYGFREGKKYAESIGFKWVSYDLGDVSEIAITKSECYAFIRTKSIATIGEYTQSQEGYILGISTDSGRNWQFIDGSLIAIDGIKSLFPNYDGKIPIPTLH